MDLYDLMHWWHKFKTVLSCGWYKLASVMSERPCLTTPPLPPGAVAPLRNPAAVIILLSAIKGAGGGGG